MMERETSDKCVRAVRRLNSESPGIGGHQAWPDQDSGPVLCDAFHVSLLLGFSDPHLASLVLIKWV